MNSVVIMLSVHPTSSTWRWKKPGPQFTLKDSWDLQGLGSLDLWFLRDQVMCIVGGLWCRQGKRKTHLERKERQYGWEVEKEREKTGTRKEEKGGGEEKEKGTPKMVPREGDSLWGHLWQALPVSCPGHNRGSGNIGGHGSIHIPLLLLQRPILSLNETVRSVKAETTSFISVHTLELPLRVERYYL